MEVLEDLTLGRRVKQRGYAQRVALGVDMVNVRWARGAFGVVDNLTKNLAIWRGGIVWRGTFYSLHDLRRRAGK
jgi:hypothetical protein